MNIRAIMQAKYPAADFSRYFAHLEQASGDDHDHHIAPRAEFKKLEEEPDNIIPVSYQEHFYAHYLLALAVPDCGPFQQTVVLMVNCFADKIRTDELPFFAEVYERGAQATTECSSRTFKKLNAEPEFAAARDERLKKLNAEPEFAAARDERSSATFKKLNAEPEFAAARDERGREHMKKTHAQPEFAAAHAERGREHMKKLHAQPEFAAARDERSSERLKKLNAEPEFAAARDERSSERMKKLHAEPEFAAANAERSSEHMKKLNHIRWHVKRGIVSPKCSLCSAALKVSTPLVLEVCQSLSKRSILSTPFLRADPTQLLFRYCFQAGQV
jgi:hypothetical protein